MVKKQLILPRINQDGVPYLSYSQISTWKKSKRDYIRQYFFGETDNKDFLKPYGDFGHKVGEALENNDFSEFTKKEQILMKSIPRYDEFERKICLQMDGFIIEGYIDTNTISRTSKNKKKIELVDKIADYKTGEIEKRRPEYESDDYLQIPIYAAAIQQETGQLPSEAYVFLIERNGNAFKGEKLTLGDEFITIVKDVCQEKIDKVLKDVQVIAEEISNYYKLYLTLSNLI
jgi:hypothetical protein